MRYVEEDRREKDYQEMTFNNELASVEAKIA